MTPVEGVVAPPPQPAEDTWTFVDALRHTQVHPRIGWTRRHAVRGEVSFAAGLRPMSTFPDPDGLLDTAYADFGVFLRSAGIEDNGEGYPLTIRYGVTSVAEEYRLTVTREGCQLQASDTEGIRRGLVFIEDEMQRRGGPFLPFGSLTRTPVIRTRIARCFYGPINRPPKMRDELADETDYYPEEYLNRLAHEGVNVLWITVNWYELIPSRIIPEYGRRSGRRLEKLRRTVAKCRRYGIRIYPFCIEPAGFSRPAPELRAAAEAHPDLVGHNLAFCTGAAKGRAYVEEAVRTLFQLVPGLGGLVVIPVGERQTHCCSGAIPGGGARATPTIACPRCGPRKPRDVLADTLAAMRRGMDAAGAGFELVAWPYGQLVAWGAEQTVDAAGHMPPGVILQHNFETGGVNRQLGKPRPTWDYWLSYVGPSDLFRRCARAARANGTRVSAKLQVGCSHEVATTQVVPVPGLLYRKYRAMRRLGVSSAMHSWLFGTYPSLMTRAAGDLSFDPLPRTAGAFLSATARRDWGRHAPRVVRAWRLFEKGYACYPTAHIFGYFGPMHDGPAWPLYLVPRRLPLAPTWQLGYPPSGDYVAECVTNGFTLAEVITLCRRMAGHWRRGVRILQGLRRAFAHNPERLGEIGLATALGLQFESGARILRFYQTRERLAEARAPAVKRRLLAAMRRLVRQEINASRRLLPLAEADSRLGFHSEAEGYKYFPALLRWRIDRLRRLLSDEFPRVARQARRRGVLWPEYVGETPRLAHTAPAVAAGVSPDADDWAVAPAASCTHWLRHVFNPERWRQCGYDPHDHLSVDPSDRSGRTAVWQALWTRDAVFLRITCQGGAPGSVHVFFELSRTQPRRVIHITPDGPARCVCDDGYIAVKMTGWQVTTAAGPEGWSAVVRLTHAWLGQKRGRRPRPFRVNVMRVCPIAGPPGTADCSWARREPARGRLVWGTLNPATDFGWLRFRQSSDTDRLTLEPVPVPLPGPVREAVPRDSS